MARDPRDAVISYYHHHKLFTGYTGKFEAFAEIFLADQGKKNKTFKLRLLPSFTDKIHNYLQFFMHLTGATFWIFIN